jgi:hypothetical protein
MKVVHLGAEHHDRALATVVAGVRELEGIGTRDSQLAIRIAFEAKSCKGNSVVEEL